MGAFMRLLITGGLGYLGGRLAQYWGEQGEHEIVLGTRHPAEPPRWLPQARLVQTRWDSLASLEESCSGVDAVIHLAGMNAQDCNADPVAALEFNGTATARLLQAAIRQKVKKFIYLSTAHVYGSPLAGVITEETCPVSLHPYTTSHRAGEDVVRGTYQRGEIEGVVIRLSNAYGAPAHKDANCWMLLVSDLCRQAVTTRRMVLKSTGVQRRDFVSLSEVCRAIDHLMRLPGENLGKGLFNVGGEWSPTVWEMACFVRERSRLVLGFQPELTRVPPPFDEVAADLDYRLDALHQTGFHPSSDRVAEIDRLLEFCKASFL
jgi:UDP-glucose 4-epimerase